MSLELITALYFIVLFAILFMGLHVAFGFGGTAVLFAIILEPRALLSVRRALYSQPRSPILITVPPSPPPGPLLARPLRWDQLSARGKRW